MDKRNIDFDALEGATVYDSENKKVGTVGQIYLDTNTDEPKFVTVNTGLFGTKETFVPYEDANHTSEGLKVPFTKDFISDAPNVDANGPLEGDEQHRIFDYYQLGSGATRGTHTPNPETGSADVTGPGVPSAGAGAGHHVDAEAQATAHEERLKVGTEQHQSGQARLRKRVRTEHQTVEVPVKREELVVERESVDPDSPEARAASKIDGNADAVEETVTLREEHPVVDKETVATEKVNVGKRTVQDTETIEGDVRKEEIEVEGDDRPDTHR
jgi:uncharacterized protein (TIGR02271 family)